MKTPLKTPKIFYYFNLYGILAVLMALSISSFAQKQKAGGPQFDTSDFSKKAELAEWLVKYDWVAWHTSDVVMTENKDDLTKLGKEWFCFQDDQTMWHAVYGKYVDGHYNVVFHYTVDATGKITKTSAKTDQVFLDANAKALVTSGEMLRSKIPANSPKFNQYIRLNSDKTIDVWMFPAFQTNGLAVYGGEGIYQLDSTGSKIVKDTSYFQEGFRGFKTDPPREISLNYSEVEKPTLGTVFFVWYYKSYFTKIFIDNSKSISTVVNDGKNNYIWVNAEKDDKKDKKESKPD